MSKQTNRKGITMNLTTVILSLNILLLMVALVNYLLAPRVGRKRIKNPESSFPEKVSILIPCRNEYENIGILLENLKAVKYGILEILVYDDNSDDNTAEIVLHYAATDHRIKLIPGKTKPQGWQGKTHACDQLSRNASGKYMLFLDADVRMTADGFYSLYKDMLTKDYDLMTVFPSQLCVSKGEKLVVPVMHRILLTLLPVPLMRQKFFSSLSAANGQVMFFKSVTYNSYHLHERFKMAVVEDISIVRFMKREKLNVMCFLGNGYIHCRMYTSYKDAINGFAKNAVHFFGGSYLAGLLYATMGILSYVILFMTMNWHYSLLILLGIHLSTELIVARLSHASSVSAVMNYPLRGFILLQILFTSYKQKINKTALWKGRNIYS